jgi:hypothetical protein
MSASTVEYLYRRLDLMTNELVKFMERVNSQGKGLDVVKRDVTRFTTLLETAHTSLHKRLSAMEQADSDRQSNERVTASAYNSLVDRVAALEKAAKEERYLTKARVMGSMYSMPLGSMNGISSFAAPAGKSSLSTFKESVRKARLEDAGNVTRLGARVRYAHGGYFFVGTVVPTPKGKVDTSCYSDKPFVWVFRDDTRDVWGAYAERLAVIS